MSKYVFFLGCIAPLRYPGIEKSTKVVCEKLGIELVEFEDASCCPAPGVIRAFSRDAWLAAAARNLALAEKQGLDIVTICNGCYGSLFDAAHELNNNKEKLAETNKILAEIGLEYNGDVNVYHFAELLHREVGLDKIKEAIVNPVDYQVATFYGCHFLKPSKNKALDNPEVPTMLDELVEATGATSVPRLKKMMCCGAGGGVRSGQDQLALKHTKENLENMVAGGSEYIVDICPFCHLQFDSSQKDLGYNLPVLHLSQLYGIAMGMDASELGLDAHKVEVKL